MPPLKCPTVPKPAGGCAPRPQGPTSPAGPSIGSARCVLGSDSKITVFSSFAYQASGYRAPGWSELPVREATPPPTARAVEGRLADTRLCLFFTHNITIWEFTGRKDSSGNQRESATLFPQDLSLYSRRAVLSFPQARRAGAAAPGGI